MIDKDGYLKLTDFGLSKQNIKGNSGGHTICGTPEYIAPEILLNQGHGTPVDWWTLGVLVYELMLGYPPFEGGTPLALYKDIVRNQPRYPRTMGSAAQVWGRGWGWWLRVGVRVIGEGKDDW